MAKQYDITIVGAGLIGASLALRLSQVSDLKIALVDSASMLEADSGLSASKEPSTKANQRVSALGWTAVSLLQEAGVWNAIDSQAKQAYRSMRVWDDNSHGQLSFSIDDLDGGTSDKQGENTKGFKQELGYIVDNNACVLALQQALQTRSESSERLDLYYQFESKDLTFDDVSATLTNHDNQTIASRLLIGADGANSWVRQQSSISSVVKSYQQKAIVATIETSKNHQQTAWQNFLQTGPLGVLPLNTQTQKISSIVWSADDAYAKQLMAMDDEIFANQLSHAMSGHLGDVVSVSKRWVFALNSRQAKQYYNKSVLLIGDAAHGIHPLAGQGANLGFKDVTFLLQQVQSFGDDFIESDALRAKLLRRYQRVRRFDNQQTDYLMSALYSAYQPSQPWYLSLRGVVMNSLNQSTLIKRQLVKQAIGLS